MDSMHKGNFSVFYPKNFSLSAIIFLFVIIASKLTYAQTGDSWKVFDDSEVARIDITIDQQDLNWIYNHVDSDSVHVAKFHFKNKFIDESYDSIGFRLRGNTSRYSQKKSFKISFNSFFKGGKFYDLEKMNLNGEHNDPSIARSKICWDLYRELGLKATRAAHVAVYINNQYYGLYLNVEHIDEKFINKNFADPSGNLWRCLYKADLSYLGDSPDRYKPAPGSDYHYELKTNADEDDYSEFVHLVKIINTTPAASFPDSIQKILDVASVLKYFAFNLFVGSWDDYRFLGNNYYLYNQPDKNLFYLIPYDYDNTFGVSWFSHDWATISPYNYPSSDSRPRPLADKLLAVQSFRNLYTHFLDLMNTRLYELPFWDYGIEALRGKLSPFAENDSYRTFDYHFSMDDFNNSYGAQPYRNQHVKNGIKEFIVNRHNALNTQLKYAQAPPVIYNIDWHPKNPGPNDSIYVHASGFAYPAIDNMEIQFHPGNLTVIYTYPMNYKPVENSNIPEENDLWIGVIPPLGPNMNGRFKIYAGNGGGSDVLYPGYKFFEINTGAPVTNEILINEFMASNDSTIQDEFGEYDDWLELYNPSNHEVNLKGKFLTDSRSDLTKWKFISDEIIRPGGVLLIWCDSDSSQGNLHTGFKISADGEFLALVDADSITFIDSVSFPAQSTDISWGRNPYEIKKWGFMSPTPGSQNSITSVRQTPLIPGNISIAAYPNPFNPSTTLEYETTRYGDVEIEIYNLLGESVWSYTRQNVMPGEYEVLWNGLSDRNIILNSGVYFARIKSNNNYSSIKLMLVK